MGKNLSKIIFVKISLQCNRLLRWCPYPDCNYAIKVQYPDARPVMCKCRKVFCFNCGENWHDPVKCHLLKRWIKKCDDDSETSNWIAANTKVGVNEIMLVDMKAWVNFPTLMSTQKCIWLPWNYNDVTEVTFCNIGFHCSITDALVYKIWLSTFLNSNYTNAKKKKWL